LSDVPSVSKIRLALAVLGVAGIVSSFAVLATAAPTVAHRGAAAAVYCLKSEKAHRKNTLDAATQAAATATRSAVRKAATVTKARKAAAALVARQAKAKIAFWRAHRSTKLRRAFQISQKKDLARAQSTLTAALRAHAAAQIAATRAQAKKRAAQAAYSQCT
jgi:siroheme synthase